MTMQDTCSNCFGALSGTTSCPHCGYDSSKAKVFSGVLPAFTVLHDRYLLGRVLGKGGFGITYIAKDINTNRIRAIKEYMPSEYSARCADSQNIEPFSDDKSKYVFTHGREKFMEEAQTLFKLRDNPIVVDIVDYFNQNNTAYLVMEFLDGQDLRKKAANAGGKLPPDQVKGIFLTIASSLVEIHKKNILHRDLSPENIIVTKDGAIKLIDFGAARNFVSRQNMGMSILLKPGFAPPEQYNSKGTQGPWTDVYALCATFYTLVSGRPLVDALFRYRGEKQPSLAELGCAVTQKTSDVIERGMALDYKQRYRDFMELLNDIDISSESQNQQKSQSGERRQISQQGDDHQNLQGGYREQQQPISGQPITSRRVPQQQAWRPIAMQPTPPHTLRQPHIAKVVGTSIYNKMALNRNEQVRMGRSDLDCQYVISGDTNVSRIHCVLRFDGVRVYIRDESSNGTYFESGMRLVKGREYILYPGVKFYIATPTHMYAIVE